MKAVLFFMCFISSITFAASDMPKSCKRVSDFSNTVMLKRGHTTTYLIKNVSQHQLWLTHPIANPSASAGWSSELDKNRWSALQLEKDKEAFELSCIESKPGHEQQIPCKGVIIVCDYKSIKAPKTLTSSFWAGENMPLDELMTHLEGRGYTISEDSK